jgi:uncharacterized membrane protein YgcG
MIAYNKTWLRNLQIVKEAKPWAKQSIISQDQFARIQEEYPSGFYHPNLFIRILLFIATLVAAGGVTGLLALMFGNAFDSEATIGTLSILYGAGSWLFFEMVFVRSNNHYKSGVNEALLYHSVGYTLLGFQLLVDFDEHFFLITSLLLCSFAAIRYADLVATCCAIASFAGFIIPFVFMIVFSAMYFFARSFRKRSQFEPWKDCLIVCEVISLLLIYAAGNYFVVRELSISMMDLYLEQGQDIPFAYVFYILTVGIPTLYLYVGIKKKNVILLRVSLIALAFSVFTFKYYFSLGHPEITLTVAGFVLISIAMALFRYLRTPKNGFTRDNLLDEKWAGANPEAFVISQTLGGNQISDQGLDYGGGGQSGGGGSSESW